jgi:hypothetical protein
MKQNCQINQQSKKYKIPGKLSPRMDENGSVITVKRISPQNNLKYPAKRVYEFEKMKTC